MVGFRRGWLAALAILAGLGSAASEVLDTAIARGTLVVGVKADYRPFGFRDETGALVGLEPDLAADLARRLNIKVELVPVTSANRLELLQSGKIDVLIATMSDKVQRRKVVLAVDLPYYADYATVLLPKSSDIKTWEDLRGKKLCATEGVWNNREVVKAYGPVLVTSEGTEKPMEALKAGECVGYLYDQAYFAGKMLEPAFKRDFATPLKGILPSPWIIAVQAGNPALKTLIERAVLNWTRTGLIVALERKWGIQPTDFTIKMNEALKNFD